MRFLPLIIALAACGMTTSEQLCLGGKVVAAGVSGAVGDSEDRAVKEAWSTSDEICRGVQPYGTED